MRPRLLLLALTIPVLSFGQTPGTTPMLDTGIPNLAYPPPAGNHQGQQHGPAAECVSRRRGSAVRVIAMPERFVQSAVHPHGAV